MPKGVHSDQTTGLIGHYIGTVEESFAGTNAQYQDGNVVRLTWETTVDDVLQEDYDGEVPDSIVRNITLGDGWDTDDDGNLFHEDDESRIEKGLAPKDFKVSSFYGNFLSLIAGEVDDWNGGRYEVTDGGDDELDLDYLPVKKYFESKYGSLEEVETGDPKIWLGFTWEFRTYKVKMRNNDEYNRTVPVRAVKLPEDAKVKGKTRKTTSKPTEDFPRFDFEQYGADEPLSNQLNNLLVSARNQSEFVQKALQVGGVSDNEALMTVLVSDEGPWSNR